MKKIRLLITFVLISITNASFAIDSNNSIIICSWNLKDFGKTKSDTEIEFIANTIKSFDVIIIQEVVAGYGGAQAIARLHRVLNEKGAKWDYSISDPTFSSAYKAERYAYIWKTAKIKKIGQSWLEQRYKIEVDREPFYSTFNVLGKEFTLVNFHAITKSKQPEKEVKYFKYLPAQYPTLNLIFCGDFNLPQSHTVFNPLKSMNYVPALQNEKTSLRQKCRENDCLASEFDNIFYNKLTVLPLNSGKILFYTSLTSFEEVRLISDHVPIYFEFQLK